MKITIIIPTHNREGYIKRILNYYKDSGIPIIVCDSSSIINKEIPINENITYKHFKGLSYNEKINQTLKLVKTEYAVLSADDDFIVPNSILKCVKFLDDNKDYTSCQGHLIEFIKPVDKVNTIQYSPTFQNFINVDINSNIESVRMKDLFTNYIFLYYSVHRTETLKNIFSLSSGNLEFGFLMEYFFNMYSIIEGKHKILPIFYLTREINFNSGAFFLVNLDIMVKDIKYKKELDFVINSCAERLSKNENISLKTATNIVNETLNIRLNSILNSKKTIVMKILKIADSISINLGNILRAINFYGKRLGYIKNTKKIKGYPFYDLEAVDELKYIDRVIKGY